MIMGLWLAKDYIKKALSRWDLEDGKYWAKEAIKEIEEAEAENKDFKKRAEAAESDWQLAEAENKRLKELIDLLENLLVCYRISSRPTSKVLDRIGELRQTLKENKIEELHRD